jgi:hypothetical protein
LTLDSRSREPKIDNGPLGATGLRDRHAVGSGRRSLADERMLSNTNNRKDTNNEFTNPTIASRKHHFRTDELSAVVALGDTTRGACCWTPDAALAKRACLGDIRWPEHLAMEALPHCAAMRIVAPEGFTIRPDKPARQGPLRPYLTSGPHRPLPFIIYRTEASRRLPS